MTNHCRRIDPLYAMIALLLRETVKISHKGFSVLELILCENILPWCGFLCPTHRIINCREKRTKIEMEKKLKKTNKTVVTNS